MGLTFIIIVTRKPLSILLYIFFTIVCCINTIAQTHYIITTIAGTGTAGFSGDGGAATAAELNGPACVTFDNSGNLYIADCLNDRIRKVNTAGVITTVAGNGTFGYTGGPATASGIGHPQDMAFDRVGNMYISWNLNNMVFKMDNAGILTAFAGTGMSGFAGDGGPATSAVFYAALGIAVDSAGNEYISDGGNGRIRKVSTSGIITTIAGNGGTIPVDGAPATLSGLYEPDGLALDGTGNLFIAEAGDSRIRKIDASGIITTVAGNGSAGFSGDGWPATSAQLNNPAFVCTDISDNVYIGDNYNQRVRKVDIAGIITTIAGDGYLSGINTGGYSGDYCAATAAELNHPGGVAIDALGRVYFADAANHRVRMISRDAVPWFAGGHSQSVTFCSGVAVDTINSLLAINDSDAGQGETWSVVTSPVHGTLAASDTATSTGGTLTPTGLTYTPAVGYMGNDSFKVAVIDCGGASDTTTVHVSLVTTVTAVTILGPASVCTGVTASLAASPGGEVWSSATGGGIATVGTSTGVITGLAAGTATISYTLSLSCGSAAGAVVVTVNPTPMAITGAGTICGGATTTLSDATTGGAWSSNSTTMATINSGGIVTGVSAGIATIGYTLPTGCKARLPVTVNALPAAITGTTNVCAGQTTSLSVGSTGSLSPGGAWSATGTIIATAGSATGIITGITAGTTAITYTLPTGCNTTAIVTVNAAPSLVTGATTLCSASTITISDATSGGSWSSSNTGMATINAGGIIAGVSAGTATISYTIPTTGCAATAAITVNPLPPAITGSMSVCAGATTMLSDSTSGGAWSSSATAVASAGSGGAVSGVAPGTTVISYTLHTGCMANAIVTVRASPAAITGTMQVCTGTVTTLSDATGGGAWSSANTVIATAVGSTGSPSAGIVSGVTAGTVTINYILPDGCAATGIVTVNPLPGAIAGSGSVCAGATMLLFDAGGGSWSSSSLMVEIGTATGTVTGVAGGTAAITYTLPTGCSTATIITVNSSPSAIGGSADLCTGTTTLLTDITTGGAWSSSNTAVAAIDGVTGVVTTGFATGTAVISYAAGLGCAATTMVTVNVGPLPISGGLTLCSGATTGLSDGIAGGSWSSGGTGIATIDGSGNVYGVSAGTAILSYSVGICSVTAIVTVNASPPAIRGVTEVCVGLATIMSNATTGGTWSSGNAAVASIVNATGILTGGAAGTATISYTLPDGCAATTNETVNTTPSPITGVMQTCPSATTLLSDPGGGSWSSGNIAIATVGSTGAVGGIAAGTASVIYSIGAGCAISTTVTVNPLPAAITGTEVLCAGATTTLSDGSGTWSSSNSAVASVFPISIGTGVTGVSGGTATITYTASSTGCTTHATITVNALPAAITGTLAVCQGAASILSDHTTGGVWSSSATTTAMIGSTGTVTGAAPGISVITYTNPATGCTAHTSLTVNPLPLIITGTLSECAGTTTTLTDATSSGLWTSSPGVIATVGSVSGVVNGVSAGTTIISYALPTSCATTAIVTVNPLPAITGPTAECVAATITEAASPTGGTWSSSATTVAAVISGSVTGITTGTTIITYISAAGCKATTTVTVSLSPSGIIGSSAVCTGDTTTLGDAVRGGVWSSSGVTATVGSLSGMVTGVAVGTTSIIYSLGSTGCTVTKILTINAAPAGITGARSLCVGATTALADATTGGTWSSTAAGIATISATGIVTGGAAGIDTITYSHGGCGVNTAVIVNLTPIAITGASSVCAGDSITLSDAVSGGIWSSANSGIVRVDVMGNATGVLPGTTTITYSLGAGCAATKIITVNPISPITGSMGLCLGTTTALSDATTGGTWGSSTTSVASVFPIFIGTGVTGMSVGSAVITYSTSAGCSATAVVTVNLAPSAISGTLHLCAGATTALGNTAGGGVWTSTNTAVAIIGTTGIVTGIVPGTSVITYSLGGGCIVSAVVTIDAVPSAITGVMSMCTSATTTLIETSTGGVWSIGSTTIATVSGTGLANGVSGGIVTIAYVFATGCTATALITVNPLPGLITGTSHLCAGLTATLTSATTGGSWSSGGTSIATIDSIMGVVTGIAPGTAFITFTLPSGCSVTTTTTINAAPSPITGSMVMCEGSSTVLSDPPSTGAWSSNNSVVATVTGIGVVTGGVLSGTAIISYMVGGCAATAVVTVNAPPEPLSSSRVCVGSVETLTDLPAGGTWSSSDSSIASIDETEGVLTGVSAGTAIIAYSMGAGCTVAAAVTVMALPGAITGTPEVCAGYTTTLTDAAGGGVWSSSSTSIATVTGLGVVTGVAGGPATISYTSVATGCAATRLVTVVTVPAISGVGDMCAFSSTAIVSDAITGGTWTSTSVTVSTSGMVTPYSAGAASLTYTIPLGCYITASFTVHPLPGLVTGFSRFCRGGTITFTDTTSGGTWGTSNTTVAPITSRGSVTGLSAGTAVISYVLASGCMETETITVDSFPSAGAIVGSSSVCVGATIVLADLSAGGTWSSSNTSASILGGVTSGVSPGVDTIKYIISNTCGTASATKAITTNPLPIAYSITGGGNYCAGSSGVHIGLSGSNTSINYQLYHGSTLSGSVTGTGLAVDFGLQTTVGIYTAVATNTSTGCSNNMLGTTTVTVTPAVVPVVTIAPATGDTICAGSAVIFTATSSNGGSLPAYQWLVNNIVIPGVTSNSYTYTPAGGDEIKARLISSAACALPDTVSDSTVMAVVTPVIPTVTINAAPGLSIQQGQSDTLTAIISGGGFTPVYQWEINGNPIPGATIASFVNSYSSNDTVTCVVSLRGICNTEGRESVVILVSNVGVNVLPTKGLIELVPNPNNGMFTIKGSLGTTSDETVSLEISDLLGQVIYESKVITHDGKINEQINLGSALANGMYILSLHSSSENRVFHIVIEQ